jgi:hypothetical protein
MTIHLEILESAYIYAPIEIEGLQTKELVPKMVVRRRLTRAAKIAVYLADKVSFVGGRIMYGSSFGELFATANILSAINAKESISPTHFQNSVYNTAVSYLSMLNDNKNEIMTISSGDNTSYTVMKMGAIKALDGDTLLLLVTETLNIEQIDEVNCCTEFLECGVALKVRVTQEEATIFLNDTCQNTKTPHSIEHMLYVAKNTQEGKKNIVKIQL